MEERLHEKFKESFIEMLIVSVMLIVISGTLLVISLFTYFGERDPATFTDAQSLWTMAICTCFFVGSLLWTVIMLLRYAHDRKVLAEKKYEIYEGELAYFDICISGDEEGTKNYVPVVKDFKTGKKLWLDHRDPIEKEQTYLIYRLPKTKISVAEKKIEEK